MRLRPGLTDAERGRAIDLIKEVTADKPLKPERGARYVVTGVPVVVEGLADEVRSAIFVLLGAALLLMAATLALVFRTRLRLLPLALALAAAAMTFGALSLAGGGLTMASIAVLPVLIGLAVDYAIQFQARHDEVRGDASARRARRGGAAPRRPAGRRSPPPGWPRRSASWCCCCRPCRWCAASGRCVVLGIVLALACALTAGFAALVRFGATAPTSDVPPVFPRVRARARDAGGPARRLAARAQAWARRWRTIRLGAAERGERGLAYAVAPPAAGAGRRAGRGDRGLGGGHPERGGLRRPRAGARRTSRRCRT